MGRTRQKWGPRIWLRHTKESQRRNRSLLSKFHIKNREQIHHNTITATQKISSMAIKMRLSKRTWVNVRENIPFLSPVSAFSCLFSQTNSSLSTLKLPPDLPCKLKETLSLYNPQDGSKSILLNLLPQQPSKYLSLNGNEDTFPPSLCQRQPKALP